MGACIPYKLKPSESEPPVKDFFFMDGEVSEIFHTLDKKTQNCNFFKGNITYMICLTIFAEVNDK